MDVWVEKYRPDRLNDIIGQDTIIKGLKSYVASKNLPNLLFSGPPGVGKTCAAISLVKELFGDMWRYNFTELNASVSKDTPVLVKINGEIERTNFDKLDRMYFREKDEVYKNINNLDVLSIDNNLNICWKKVSKMIRHKVDKIMRIHFEGGAIDLTGNHSIITFDSEGNLVSKSAKDIKEGEFLISFITNIKNDDKIDKFLLINKDLSWLYGAYTAEGCLGSGDIIFVWNKDEEEYMKKLEYIAGRQGFNTSRKLSGSGFSGRDNLSSCRVTLFGTRLESFMRMNFYGRHSVKHTAITKRIPNFMYNTNYDNRLSYLKGEYDGDGTGDWDGYFRITSRSKELLIDLAWFARITGLPSSVFPNDYIVHFSKKDENIDLIPSDMIINLLEKIPGDNKYFGNWRHELRHNLYSRNDDNGPNKLISKKTVRKLIEKNKIPRSQTSLEMFYGALGDNLYEDIIGKIDRLLDNDLCTTKITKIEIIDYDDYVYDFAVPDTEMFFAGNIPILLHNSDERGIDVVRGKIKDFARSSTVGESEFKVIFLDESDALTTDAQAALRRTMENYTNICRFILSCNYSSKIIEPIQSRCSVYKFRPLPDDALIERIIYIAKEEDLDISPGAINAIKYVSQGDLRRAINALQSAAIVDKKIDIDAIYKTSALAKPEDIDDLILLSLQGNFIKAHIKLDYLLNDEGLAGTDITGQIYKQIFNINIPDKLKINLIDFIGEIDFRISEGANEKLQLSTLLSKFMLYGINKT